MSNFDERTIEQFLEKTGMRSKLRGFVYLKDALMLYGENTKALIPITKKLYPVIAEKYSITDKNVEVSIRRTISKAWLENESQFKHKMKNAYDGDIITKPTNTEFILNSAYLLTLESHKSL